MIGLVEVGPRDGLQNEDAPVATAVKLELIARLVACGLQRIEITACVSSRAVPQMADHREVIAAASPLPEQGFSVLVPNAQGMRVLEEADEAGNVAEVAVFTAASETFAQRNINCSIAASLERFAPVAQRAEATGRRMRGYVSTTITCPYEGPVDPGAVERVAEQLAALGCSEISLGDTVGSGTPATVARMVRQVAQSVPVQQLAIHLHDTQDNAIANMTAAIECGVQTVDASAGGLGGCPFAPGAKGNVATEKVATWLAQAGLLPDGINAGRIAAVGEWIRKELAAASAAG